tara:strand:+ start:1411 stop:1908 length:498 start_codon:yes stop_codon:yes gene_type:complete
VTTTTKGNKMKQLSQQAQVAKLLKQKAKELGINVISSKSDSFAGGNSVTLRFNSGSDDAVNQLKDYSHQFEAGHFDGMTDMYEYDNCRDDVPQTKYLSLNDCRADKILGDLAHYQTTWFANGEKVNFAQFMYRLKNQSEDWQGVLQNLADGEKYTDFEIIPAIKN